MLARDEKVERNCPCLFSEYDMIRKRWNIIPPAVDCSFDCSGCGWNIEEQQRRLKDGEWVEKEDGTKCLLFKGANPSETTA